jgi:GT2 family glycosyltransferase
MAVTFCIVTYNRPDKLPSAVDAALMSDIGVSVTVIDNSLDHYAQGLVDDRATVITLPHNAGLGPALNLAYSLYDDYLVVGNDDLAVHPHTVRELVEHAEQFPSYKLLFGDHDDDGWFSLYLLRKQTFLELGGYDPAIVPVYYDDLDLLYRLRLLGYEPVTVHAATYDHVKNGHLKVLDPVQRELHERQFRRNEEYYKGKWGGHKFEERYTKPFNGGRPVVPPLIKE